MIDPIEANPAGWEYIHKLESERDSLQRRLDEALALIEESRKQEPVAQIDTYDGNFLATFAFCYSDKVQPGAQLYAKPPIASVPEGMVLVPKEPTEEMKKAAEDSFAEATDLGDIYKAMLSAAEVKK